MLCRVADQEGVVRWSYCSGVVRVVVVVTGRFRVCSGVVGAALCWVWLPVGAVRTFGVEVWRSVV